MPKAIESIANFLSDEKFLVPFLAIVGASLTMMLLQFIGRFVNDRRQKLYATNYISDVCLRVLMSNLILKKHTIDPHIEATKRILAGDTKILDAMFLSDEFDILTDKMIRFEHLPEEYKVLLGCDDIKLVQAFDFVNYMGTNEIARENLNEHVKKHLKSEKYFVEQPPEKQRDILNTYSDYLERINHNTKRIIYFVCYIVKPLIKDYIRGKQFILFPTKGVKKVIEQIEQQETKYCDVIPKADFMENIMAGGIQNVL